MSRAADPLLSSATLVELLRKRAALAPDRIAYTFLEDGEREGPSLTFGELDRRARAVAAALQERGLAGERALLLYPAGLDFVVAFCGCLYAGVVAVPAPASDPAQFARTLPRLSAIARDAEPRAVLTTGDHGEAVRAFAATEPSLARAEVLESDGVPAERADAWRDPGARPDDLAFLQYTSGSTSDPKGVMVSHGNLLYTAADIDAGWGYDEQSVVVSWLPIFHDMGLVCGIVLPMYKGCRCVLMSPVAFVQRPARWLRAVTRYRGTHSAAPNFAYELCARKIGPAERAELDLSSLEVTLCSAEPVRYETLIRFDEAFSERGFRWDAFCPGFGLAEATVKLTASRKGQTPLVLWLDQRALEEGRVVTARAPIGDATGRPTRDVRPLVGNGADMLDTLTLIVDPETRRLAAPDAVGEIWAMGPCVAQGYWRRPEDTARTFGAELADAPEGVPVGPWMRTGDLGFKDESGELFTTGRLKDLLILFGRNVYPQDVEQAAEAAHAALRPGGAAAFALELAGEERLGLLAELDPRAGADPAEVAAAVRRAVGEAFEVETAAVALVPPRALPKTSSGKVQRRAARARLEGLGGELLFLDVHPWAVAAQRPAGAGRRDPGRAVADALARALGAAADARPLAEQGLGLAQAREVALSVAAEAGVVLPPLAFAGATAGALVARAEELAAAEPAGVLEALDEHAAPLPERLSPSADTEAAALAVEAWLADRLAERLGLSPAEIEVDAAFAQFGLDSLKAVELVGDLEEWLGVALPATLTWDHPTVERLARHLASRHAVPAAGAAAPERATSAATASAPPAPRSAPPAVEAIAIVGIGCRFPGAHGPDAYWELLAGGVDAVREVPRERFDVDRFYDPRPGQPGKLSTRWGGFLEDVDKFDAPFFGVAAREASRMDPQQRLLLETAWEALEHAGISPDGLRGGATGVFVGLGATDYVRAQLADPALVDAWAGTGNAYSIAANRLSYALDLRGPSLTVDTACSASLVAAHLARRSLLSGECDLALAGGASLILGPEWTIAFSHAEMMAKDGRCKTFDAAADGYVRSEGVGFVVLKRLSDAERDGDRVLAVILGSAVNQDGRTNGLTAPNGESQQAVLRAALADARVAPADVAYVEAHGTGTPLGDPIELAALAAVMGEGRARDRKLRVGSVKTNLGHMEAAAGVGSLAKVALALERGELPRQLHFRAPNPHVDLARMPLEIAAEHGPWPAWSRGRRIAGVSSFGFGGTNAHLVLGEAPARASGRAPESAGPDRPRHVACLSARTEEALRESARRLEAHLAQHPELALADVCHTLSVGRAHLAERFAATAETTLELRAHLEAFAGGGSAAASPAGDALSSARGSVSRKDRARTAFLFTGQGSQYAGMGRALYETQPVFRRELERAAECLRDHLERPLLEVLFAGKDAGSPLHETECTQPALVALEWALAAMWRSFGLEPAFVLGHSAGEYAAAIAAGALSLEDGLALVALRARLMQRLPKDGAMAAILAEAEEVERAVQPYAGRLSIAGYNGPRNTVVSGERAALDELVAAFEARGVRAAPLKVSHAFHSPLMDPVLDDFERAAAAVSARAPELPLVSNVTGAPLEGPPDARYWRRHLREPVRFAKGVEALVAAGCNTFVEVGPHPILCEMGRRAVPGVKSTRGRWHPTLRRGMDDWRTLCDTAGRLFVQGVALDWRGLDGGAARRRVALPTYPFERARHWFEADDVPGATGGAASAMGDERGGVAPRGVLERLLAHFREQNALLLRLAGELSPEDRARLEAALAGGAVPGLGALPRAPRAPRAPESAPAGPRAPRADGDAPVTRARIEEVVRELAGRIAGVPATAVRGDSHLNGDLGFDSLMTVDLDRALRRTFPALDDSERMFTEDITIDELVHLLSGNLGGEAKMEFLTEHQKEKKTYAEYADLIRMDPEKTYVGGAFRDETHTLHTIRAEGRALSGRMDMNNKYAGTANFHLTQMGAYSFIVQLIQGYLCYKYGIQKERLGMPKLVEIDMHWKGMVRRSKDVSARIEERFCTEKDGVYRLEFVFDLENGACTGRLIGICPIQPAEDALRTSHEELTPYQRTPREFATHAELIGMDPRDTYQGGVFKDEKHRIHAVELEGRVVKGMLDVENKYSDSPTFHLTQMGAYSYIVQLLLGYLCYKHGLTKEQLGMPTLREFSIRWNEMVPYPRNIPCRVEERSCTVENGRYKLEFGFEIGDGNGRGSLIGLIPMV